MKRLRELTCKEQDKHLMQIYFDQRKRIPLRKPTFSVNSSCTALEWDGTFGRPR